jgi:choline dehydrogenase-like flavoprotein
VSDGRVYTGDEVTSDLTLSCDVCIIGSGAGGGVLAFELASRGKSVIQLEEGGYHTRREFDLTEATAYPNLYQELGNRTTDDLSITILQGRSVGGGTTVNWCSSFRTPKRILDHWRDVHGVEGLSEEALSPHWDWIEKRLHIAEWPEERINRNNRVLWDGCGKLGYGRGLIRRNVHNCANLGYCGMGCPVDAKQSTLVTFIPDAVEKGLTLYANTSARTLELSGRRVVAVHAEVLDPKSDTPTGRHVTVRPKLTAVCGGAINSPGLLLRSGLDGNGRVGKRFFIHPTVAAAALFDEPVEAYSGAPQSVHSHHFIERGPGKVGFFLEVPPVHPLLAATSLGGFGLAHEDMMAQLPKTQGCIALSVDGLLPGGEGGTVALRSRGFGRYKIDYPLDEPMWESFRASVREMARIQLAAGARQVMTLHSDPVVMTSEAELGKLDAATWEKLRMKVFTAHQMGGCAMGKDPAQSVVDSKLRYHSLDNLFVVDGSVFPTALGVNPQESIFGLARWGAQHVLAALG